MSDSDPPARSTSPSPAGGVIAVPIKSFRLAKERLAGNLDPQRRERLMRATADRVAAAALGTGADVLVVTGDADVAAWATAWGTDVLEEPRDGGLNAAATAVVAHATGRGAPWCIVHGDLPLIEAPPLTGALTAASAGYTVLAPSRVGGTNVAAGTGPMLFRYGPASFHRHLAELGDVPIRVVMSVATALDLDTLDDLIGAASLPGGAWLAEYLPTDARGR